MSAAAKAGRRDSETRSDARISRHALDLDRYIPAYLSFLAGKLSSGASTTYRPKFGVGITDWRIMALLAGQGWIGAGRICTLTGLDKAAVSRSVRALEQNGVIEVRPDRADQRRQIIALTEQGLALHDRIVTLAVAREEALLQGLSEAERKTLLRLLIHLQKRLRAANATGAD